MAHYVYDAVIYGDSTSGVETAIAIGKRGWSVLLISPCGHVGGMPAAGGLCYRDIGEIPEIYSGPARDAYDTMIERYADDGIEYAGLEPHVVEADAERRLRQARVDVLRHAFLRSNGGVRRVASVFQRELSAIIVDTPFGTIEVTAKYYSEASNEGDLMDAAGVSNRLGREGMDEYDDEPFAGCRPLSYDLDDKKRGGWPHKHDFAPGVIATGRDGLLLPGITTKPMVGVGQADHNIMAMQFRATLSADPANQVSFPRPSDYNPYNWELLARQIAALRPPTIDSYICGTLLNLPNKKADGNGLGGKSHNIIDGSQYDYIMASQAKRALYRAKWRRDTEEFFYFLAHDPAVPKYLRDDMNRFGFPADEYVDNDHFPYLPYVREGRRMVGGLVLTAHELLAEEPISYSDTIAMAAYHLDSREVQAVAVKGADGRLYARTEGYLSVFLPRPYSVPYRCLTPKRSECTNLLVTTGISATHVAFSSARMAPSCAMYGNAAGVAIAQLLEQSIRLGRTVAVQDVNIKLLRRQLEQEGQVTSYDFAMASR